MEKILSFSGGKDSTALLLKLIEENMQLDKIIWVDVGMEFPEMYDHINKVEDYIKRPITRLTPNKTYEELLLKYGVPTQRVRWCTKELKIKTIQKYLRGREYSVYMGFALGEEKRKARFPQDKYIFPLIDEFKMTEKDCLNYCYEKGFDWGGLYNRMDRLSCWCCPLQKISDFKVIWEDYPEFWQKLKSWEKELGQSWLIKQSTDILEVRYELEKELGFPISKFKVHQDMLKKRLKERGLI
jgi:3'-phosphoadenosine 5'-phosphosulfate sulfotransferase (PAPS reductase)/FAD synthetase